MKSRKTGKTKDCKSCSRVVYIYLVLNILLLGFNVGWSYFNQRKLEQINLYRILTKDNPSDDYKTNKPNCVIEDYMSDNPREYQTLKTEEETKLLNKYLSKSKVYFEYGSGGSTFEALKHKNVDRVYSVENRFDWMNDFMYRFKFIRDNEDSGRLKMLIVDTGPVGEWGYPLNYGDYRDYPEQISKDDEYKKADFVLVDGRFRVACVMQALLNVKKDALIALHDVDRSYYSAVWEFLEEVERVDKLTIFKIKDDLNLGRANSIYEQYRLDAR